MTTPSPEHRLTVMRPRPLHEGQVSSSYLPEPSQVLHSNEPSFMQLVHILYPSVQ